MAVIDYARPTTAELAGLPWRSWLRTYRGHDRGGGYLSLPGDQDITADVALDQLPEPDVVRSQAHFLQRWGIDELVAEGRRQWAGAAAAPDLAALTMRSRVREAEALLDADGLGGFTVAEWQLVSRRDAGDGGSTTSSFAGERAGGGSVGGGRRRRTGSAARGGR